MLSMKRLAVPLFMLLFSVKNYAQTSDPEAIRKADLLIERLGGHKIWAEAKHLYTKEKISRININGEFTGEFWRSYTKPAYIEKLKGSTIDFEELRNVDSGWSINKGVITKMEAEDLFEEWKGSQQEPYRIYHRIARKDSNLVIKLVGESRLDFYERNGRKLCWILIDKSNAPVSWGNIYRSRLNQHNYGPLKQFGNIYMPTWGVSIDAVFRFEYTDIKLLNEELKVLSPFKK
jgi:hypothetical protein